MPSTVIRRFDHLESGDLVITFTTGRRYRYAHVPRDEVRAFRAAFSKGEYFNHHIRNRYDFVELESAD